MKLGHQYFPVFRLQRKHWLFPGLGSASLWIGTYTIGSPGCQAFQLGLELHHRHPWVSSLPTQPAHLRTHQSPSSCEPTPHDKSVSLLLDLFLQNPNTVPTLQGRTPFSCSTALPESPPCGPGAPSIKSSSRILAFPKGHVAGCPPHAYDPS